MAFADGAPHFPLVCERLLHGDRSIPLTFVLFDVLELDGETVIDLPYAERRAVLEGLALGAGPWVIAEAFADGAALFAAACSHGLEGVVAKRRSERYRPGERRWIKVRTGTTGATAQRSSRCGGALSDDSFASADGDSDRDPGRVGVRFQRAAASRVRRSLWAPMHHKRKRPKHRRAGCLLCKPSKLSTNKTADRMRARRRWRRDWDENSY